MGCKILKRDSWPWPRPFQGWLDVSRLGLATVNLQTKFEVSNYTHYEDMISGAKCANWGSFGHSGVTQCHRQCHHSIERIRLLFDFNRNYVSIILPFSRWPVICRKSPILTHPTCIWRPRKGWPRWNFAEIFGVRKLKSLGYRVVLFVWSYMYVYRFSRTPTCDRQTDRQHG